MHKISTLEPEYSIIQFYRRNALKSLLIIFFSLPFSPIVLPLLLYAPKIKCILLYTKTNSDDADFVLLQNASNKKWSLENTCPTSFNYKETLGFEYRKQKYVLLKHKFRRIDPRLVDISLSAMHSHSTGLKSVNAWRKREQDGPNLISIDSESIMSMILYKLFHPFYLFQIASVNVWFYNGYPYYAVVIALLSSCSAAWEIYSSKKNESNLRQLVNFSQPVSVLRDGSLHEIDSSNLVVGDIVVISSSTTIVCDICLLQGQCVVDESSLTGETTPVVKNPLPTCDPLNRTFNPEVFKPHTLFSGSTVTYVQALTRTQDTHNGESSAFGVVIATGFSSTKGQLFRSILYPNDIDLRINRQSISFLCMMIVIAFGAFAFKVVTGIQNGEEPHLILLNSLDLITVAVPPALPLVLSLGIGFAMSRLKSKRIYCINPSRINFAGWIDLVCWDKTGTLTHSKLEFQGIHNLYSGFYDASSSTEYSYQVQLCLAACHSLNLVNGQVTGQFVDTEMFRSSGARMNQVTNNFLDIPGIDGEIPVSAEITLKNSVSVEVLKRFDFDSDIQRSAVVVYSAHDSIDASLMGLVKGSPEKIKEICSPSTIPENYIKTYHMLANHGYYVIALGWKELTFSLGTMTNDLHNLSRNTVENDLTFCGFALFKSPIKQESFPTIEELERAQIRSVIITGDGPHCAVHVARNLGLMDRNVILIDANLDLKLFKFDEIPIVSDIISSPKRSKSSCSVSSSSCYSSESVSEPSSTYSGESSSDIGNSDSNSTIIAEDLLKSLGYSQKSDTISEKKRIEDVFGAGKRNCKYAITSNAFYLMSSLLDDDQVKRIMDSTVVYARARPYDKTVIVEKFITSGKYVAMTGDGTNDSGAMKAAHVGLALSDTEASIVAPFSSASKSISDIPVLLREGRCSLDTAFNAFKFMAVYPVIQMMTSIIAYYFQSQMGNPQYLVDDLGIAFCLAAFMLYTGPSPKLTDQRPVNSLFSSTLMYSLIGQIAINMGFTIFNVAYLLNQPWYCSGMEAQMNIDPITFLPLNSTKPFNENYPCYWVDPARDVTSNALIATYEATFAYCFGHFQLIAAALAFSAFSKFRKPMTSNFLLIAWIFLSFAVCSVLLLVGHESPYFDLLRSSFQFRDDGQVPMTYRLIVYSVACLNILVALLWDWIVFHMFPTPRLALPNAKQSLMDFTPRKSIVQV